uniref:Uncharacterized protein n=1 Tax=Setaria italica TaxID=4555 RepID=K4ANL0_SETIT
MSCYASVACSKACRKCTWGVLYTKASMLHMCVSIPCMLHQ